MAIDISCNSFIQDDILTQPVMLSRSDAILSFPSLSSPSSIVSDEMDALKKQEKRKWEESFDSCSISNIQKAQKQDQYMEELHESEDDQSISSIKKPGRKPLADEELSEDDDPKIKRKAQNRAAQRAFRERKERYVKELEGKLKLIQDAHTLATNQLYQENQHLKSIIYRLEAENVTLKSIHIQHGTLSGKSLHEWIETLIQQQSSNHHHQQQQQQQQQYPFSLLNPSNHSTSSTPTSSMIGPLPISTAINNNDTLMGSSLFSSLSSLATSSPSLPFTSANLMHPHEQNHHPSSILNQNDPSIIISSKGLKKSSSTQSNHKVEYTFSISTPDTLRSRQKKSSSSNSSSSSSLNNGSSKPPQSPVELVRLYPIEQTVSVKNHHQEVVTPKSPTPSISSRASSVISTPTMACQVFCDKLQEEVCTNSFDHLLSEPLFDLTTGSLNESIIVHPSNNQYNNNNNNNNNNDHGDSDHDDDQMNNNSNDKMDDDSISSTKKFLSSQEIWKRLSEHRQFRQYSTDQLLKMVKSLAKCTHMGPVLTEQDIHFIMDKMNQGIL